MQEVHLAPAQAGADHQPVEHAQLGPGVDGGVESIDQPRASCAELETGLGHRSTYAQPDIVDEDIPSFPPQREVPGHCLFGDQTEALDRSQQ